MGVYSSWLGSTESKWNGSVTVTAVILAPISGKENSLLDGLGGEVRSIGRDQDVLEQYSSPPVAASFSREDCRKSRSVDHRNDYTASSHCPGFRGWRAALSGFSASMATCPPDPSKDRRRCR